MNGIDKTRPIQINAEGTRRTQQEIVIEALHKFGQGLHQEGARDGMGERLRLGHKLRNIQETGVGPHKGKNTGESLELPKTCGRSEDHQEQRRLLQGAKRSHKQRLKAHPEGSWSNHHGKPPVVSKWEPTTPLDPPGDLNPKERGRWDRKGNHFVNECVSPHCKLDPPKGDAIAKAVKHQIKKAEYQRSEQERDQEQSRPKG